ncbi:penicillin-insensitive murein endopeptidase, partial [Erwinia amylovora]
MKKMLAALLLCATTIRHDTPWQTDYNPVSG